MSQSKVSIILYVLAVFVIGMTTGLIFGDLTTARAQAPDRVYELRTYTTHPGRLDALHERFTQHTMRLFERHGMTNMGYFTPQDASLADNTLVYLLAHVNRDAATANWQAFIADPEWQAAYRDSIAAGPLIVSIDSVMMNPTGYSPLR